MQGLSLNTPPKPKQAKAVELTGGRAAVAGGRQEPGAENKRKIRKGVQQTGGCNGVEARKSLEAELQCGHGDLELDQQGLPGSWNSRTVGHSAAQGVIVAIGSKGWSTSIVKKERFLKAGHWMGGLHCGYNSTKLQTGTKHKSNRLWSKVSKIRVKTLKHKR